MGELLLNNILSEEEIDGLFSNGEKEENNTPKNDEEKQETTEVDEEVDSESTDEEPESVGSDEDNEEKEGTSSLEDRPSPNNNFYSSIASALKEDGIFPDLDNDLVEKIKTPEDFAEAVEAQVQARLDERQKRIDAALNAEVDSNVVNSYERTIDYLNSIEDSAIEEEGEKGEELRKQLIYQDFINRGYKKERASREVQKSIDAGTDIDDAKEALASNIDYFKEKYDDVIKEAQAEQKKVEAERKETAAKLKKSIIEDSKVFGDVEIDKSTRQKVYDSISKPVYKDADSGEYLTAVQKYERDNPTDFLKNVGLLYTLTNGFKNLDALVNTKVKKEMRKSIKALEHTINSTSRNSDGNLSFASGVDDMTFDKGWKLDI
jgi:hypothetical protein